MASFCSYFAAHAAYRLYDELPLSLVIAAGSFVVWGVGVNIASVSYLSLVTDLTEGQEGWRSRAISVMWTAMILSTIVISIHAQDVLLEPYGAETLGMTASQTSRLTAVWGVGVFTTLTVGVPIMRRLGKKRSANLGACLTAIAFACIIGSGLAGNVNAFMASVLGLGLGGGLMTVSNLSFMLDMTVPQAAGLYWARGVWPIWRVRPWAASPAACCATSCWGLPATRWPDT